MEVDSKSVFPLELQDETDFLQNQRSEMTDVLLETVFLLSNNECWEIPPVPGARGIVSATTPLSAPAAMVPLLGRRPWSASVACVG